MLSDELENYFDNTIIPQLFIDGNLELRKFTPPAMKQFTLSPGDIGKSIRDIVGHIRYPTLIENIEEVIATGKNLEKEIQTLDLKWFHMNIMPYLIRKEQRANGVIITFVDITNRIHTLQEVQKLNSEQEIIIYSVSHDIKQPLSALVLMPEALENAFDNKDTILFNSHIERLHKTVKNIRLIVNELTELIKNKTKITSEIERVNIENIFEDVTLILKDEIYQKKVTINTEFSSSEIIFSRQNLRSILYNLLYNAIKYADPKRSPVILVKTEKIPGYIMLSIQDNGMGIELENQEMIFKRYTRINNEGSGTGIGLYLVRTILENEMGKIEVSSSYGEGSTFRVYFRADSRR